MLLCNTLNERILELAPKHIVSAYAPDTFETLSRNIGGLVVWDGGSDNTIYGDAKVNWAFRAWHDSLHLKLNADFSLEGETRVALEQARILGGYHAEIVLAEVIGQAEYFAKHGEFPTNQVEFIKSYLKGIKV
jgi:hypothetical protein